MGESGGRGGCFPRQWLPSAAGCGPRSWMRSLPSPPASLVQLQPPLCFAQRGKAAGDSQPWIPPDLPPPRAASERHRAAKTSGSSAPAAIVPSSTQDRRQRFMGGAGGWRQRSSSHKHTRAAAVALFLLFSWFLLGFVFFLTGKIHFGDCLL